jgi:hypothetical protein
MKLGQSLPESSSFIVDLLGGFHALQGAWRVGKGTYIIYTMSSKYDRESYIIYTVSSKLPSRVVM